VAVAVAGAPGEFSFDAGGDWPLIEAACRDAGVEAVRARWDDGEVDWAAFDGVVIRSPWDYLDRRNEFVAWAHSVEQVTELANPAAVIEWNTDKRYLRDLAAAGVPVTETLWFEGGDHPVDAPWPDFVVKPSVSAGAVGSARYRHDEWELARAHVASITATGRAALVQPYLHELDAVGETGTYLLGGEPSHAIAKTAILRPGVPPADDYSLAETQVSTPRELDHELIDLARRAVAAIPGGPVLYARVDTAPTADGPVLIELEVVEPHLFLAETAPHAAATYARAIKTWLG
jgi:glutathione synthase/RimK-type ligase-like ATP-grasp enzyme